MIESIYRISGKIGYTHPLHPAATHILVGAVICGFVFGLLAWITRRESFAVTAYYLMATAIIALPIVAFLGFLDWQHFYMGAWLKPIKMKISLAVLLLVLLFLAIIRGDAAAKRGGTVVPFYFLGLMTVIAIGYFGGELVYGSKASKIDQMDRNSKSRSFAAQGEKLFEQKCVLCHYVDRFETKIGPGLKGIFAQKKLPVSKREISEENIRQQIISPYKNMPPFKDLSKKNMDALIEYLKTI